MTKVCGHTKSCQSLTKTETVIKGFMMFTIVSNKSGSDSGLIHLVKMEPSTRRSESQQIERMEPQGEVYDEGVWTHQIMSVTYKNGDSYQGFYDVHNCLKQKWGKYLYSNGDNFEGTFLDGDIVEGQYTFSNGNVYKGEFKNGKFHDSRGMFTSVDGICYIGQFENNAFHGNGVCVYPSGMQYIGSWVHGTWDGTGIVKNSELVLEDEMGTIQIKGVWIEGKLNQDESCKIKWNNGDHYKGMINQNGTKIEGTYTYEDESSFVGQYEHGVNKHGVYECSDWTFSGYWEENENGDIVASGKQGEHSHNLLKTNYSGTWENGTMVEGQIYLNGDWYKEIN
eukprot:TRINITY_DN12424_c0_g1_i1.p1 TRINITY_DN12424_c0_g1~~TRINITY_DN12424_c0_g1_i1.p1  ORF type:complete len:338 (+),score=56.73 TRINITY_DN12424_c0_g1_i1:126-1139(+)